MVGVGVNFLPFLGDFGPQIIPVLSGQRLKKYRWKIQQLRLFVCIPTEKRSCFFLRNPQWVIYKLDFLSALDYSSFDLVQVGAGFELNIDVI